MSDTALREELLDAAETGNINIVDRLLSVPEIADRISEAALGEALRYAAANGHDAVVDRLLAVAIDISDFDLGQGLVLAARNGHVAIVDQVLSARSITDRIANPALGWALMDAALDGQVASVDRLLVSPEIATRIPNRALIDALEYASKKSHGGVIDRLLSTPSIAARIPNDTLGASLTDAARNGNGVAIDRILAGPGIIARVPRALHQIVFMSRNPLAHQNALARMLTRLLLESTGARADGSPNAVQPEWLSGAATLWTDAQNNPEARKFGKHAHFALHAAALPTELMWLVSPIHTRCTTPPPRNGPEALLELAGLKILLNRLEVEANLPRTSIWRTRAELCAMVRQTVWG